MFIVIGRKRKNRRGMSPENSLLPRDSNVRSRNRVGSELVLPVAVSCIACISACPCLDKRYVSDYYFGR